MGLYRRHQSELVSVFTVEAKCHIKTLILTKQTSIELSVIRPPPPLLQHVHKGVKFIDVLLVHGQFLRQRVLQAQVRTSQIVFKAVCTGDFRSRGSVTRSSAIDWELMCSERLASCGGFWNSL